MSWLESGDPFEKKQKLSFLKALSGSGAELCKVKPDDVRWHLRIRDVLSEMAWPAVFVEKGLSEGILEQKDERSVHLGRAGKDVLRKTMLRHSCGLPGSAHKTAANPSIAARTSGAPGINLKESPLAWLASRKTKKGEALLRSDQIRAGERLRSDYTFACLMPSYGASWRMERQGRNSAPGPDRELRDDVIAARQRVERILARLGPDLADVAVDVCCHLKGLEKVEAERGWPARSGKIVLKIALSRLAVQYGEVVSGPEKPRPVLGWQSGSN